MISLQDRNRALRRLSRRTRTHLRLESLDSRIVPTASAFAVSTGVSNVAGGELLDANLVNAWGLAVNPTGAFWVANNGTNTATLYTGGVGSTPLALGPFTVKLPGGAPTGEIFNSTSDFHIGTDGSGGPATFLFATENGEIVGWNANVPAAGSTEGVIAASAPGMDFKGLAIGEFNGANYLYVADFAKGRINVFDSNFAPVQLSGDFSDASLPAGYAPFNIISANGKLYVSYALRGADGDEVAGNGNGFIDVYDTNGALDTRLVTRGMLNAPWGMTIAPAGFDSFGGALLVGNFGNGHINAYDPVNGHFLGTLHNPQGAVVTIDGLWGLAFGNGVSAGDANTLYYTAGPIDETNGAFGAVSSTASLAPAPIIAVGADAGGGPHVKTFSENGNEQLSFMAYDINFRGGVRVAVGDVNGDGTPDVVTAAGTGGGPHIKIFDSASGKLIRQFMAYDPSFRGGVNVAVGDVDGDGYADIITGADIGGGPHVKVFSGLDGSVLQNFMAYDVAFRGGVRVAAADTNYDGLADVITGAGVGGGPHVKIFDATDDAMLASFMAFSSAFRGGIYLAAGDVNRDGAADVVIGTGAGVGPQVTVYDPVTRIMRQSFVPYVPDFTGGVRVAVRDFDMDGNADIITGPGPGGGPHVRIFNGTTQDDLGQFLAFDDAFRGGIFVG